MLIIDNKEFEVTKKEIKLSKYTLNRVDGYAISIHLNFNYNNKKGYLNLEAGHEKNNDIKVFINREYIGEPFRGDSKSINFFEVFDTDRFIDSEIESDIILKIDDIAYDKLHASFLVNDSIIKIKFEDYLDIVNDQKTIESLKFNKVTENKNLVANSTYNSIINTFNEDEQDNILVSEIDQNYMDGNLLCEHYGVDPNTGVNCLICECKRGDIKSYVALLVPVGYIYSMNKTVRKYTNSRMVSVAPIDFVLDKTGMEYGSINPIGLPKEWKIFIDPKVLEVERIICGSGVQKSKLSLPSKYLLKLDNAEILNDLAIEMESIK